jgi:hypothetical protein
MMKRIAKERRPSSKKLNLHADTLRRLSAAELHKTGGAEHDWPPIVVSDMSCAIGTQE